MRPTGVTAALTFIWAGAALLCAADPTPEQTEFFEKNVRPVLAGKCYGCHNSKMKTPLGGLRLDTRAGLLQGGDSGKAIIPGDVAGSRLLQAISYQHNLKMPPSGKLPGDQIEKLTAWVKMGAPDPRSDAPVVAAANKGYDFAEARKFWAFQPVRKPAVPQVARRSWVSTPVDAFLLAKLESQGLQPAAEADRRTLLRRVTFDLTGLPPKPAEIDTFLNDRSPDAFAKLVDRLLASPQYGERWARHWLDLVRYAETNGHEYDNDKHEPWRYRDYVIRAFNEDVPYDQFVREHIAGDLLPRKRLRQDGGAWESPIGTTHLWFNEVLNSATDSEKSRADDVDNQIDVASKAFLGLTVACARCHDHKFDPIPTADYYALAGVFHSTELREAVVDSPARTQIITDLSRRIQTMNGEVAAAPAVRVTYRPQDKVFEQFAGPSFGSWVPQGAAFGDAPVHGLADSRAAGSNVFAGTLTSAKFRTGKELFLHVRIGGAKADPKLKERGPLRFTIVADGYKGQHIFPDGEAAPKWKTLRLTFERERICYFEIVDRARDGHIVVDEIVFSASDQPPPTETPEPPPPASTSSAAKLAELEAEVPESEFAMIAEDRNPRDVRLHIRGSHKNLGDEVPRRFLRVIAGEQQLPVKHGSGRMQIADWMASPNNPLTARVMVNRIWKHHFGAGLVRSVDNFGKMGEPPSHPELLDYLAACFVESGWSTKAMHRMMLLSSAYRMQSTASGAAAKIDPSNKLLQHMPVRRLEGEAIRDAILAVSGSLNAKMFGPSVTP
ncbi:MAG TPA: PSD1 and planctomycete cytochrome C domain-containing protein, partial [Bryobacteraceae bacterium]|nr:PSD1 and planctomycete cytochrome C domain-containing protein [Bryobacteraceae bacterium]